MNEYLIITLHDVFLRNSGAQPFSVFSFSPGSHMGGTASPDDSWKGSLNVDYNVGPGFTGRDSVR